jgi:hypothetical protein
LPWPLFSRLSYAARDDVQVLELIELLANADVMTPAAKVETLAQESASLFWKRNIIDPSWKMLPASL